MSSPLKRLGLVVAALLTTGATQCDPSKVCPPGQVIVVLPGGGLACRAPTPPTTTVPPTTTTTTTTTTTLIPVPSPTPTVTPEPAQCDLPAMPRDCGEDQPRGPVQWGCCREDRPSRYSEAVDAAVNTVKSWDGMMHPDGRVVNEDVFMASVISEMRRAGFCASRGGPDDELAAKKDNGWSEQFDLLWGSTVPRKTWVHHTVSCVPARW